MRTGSWTGPPLHPYPEYGRANFFPWNPFHPRRMKSQRRLVDGIAFEVLGSGFRVLGFEFRDAVLEGLRFRVEGLGFGVSGLSFQVWGFGKRVS